MKYKYVVKSMVTNDSSMNNIQLLLLSRWSQDVLLYYETINASDLADLPYEIIKFIH